MDYKIEHKERQKFLALVRTFPNEISSDYINHSIPDFWTECYERNLIAPMQTLLREGQRNIYGLCSSLKDSETHFNYGIGILIDENIDQTELACMIKNGYSIWETESMDYVVFKCFGSDSSCIGETWSKFFNEFIPQTGYMQTDDTDYEIYFENAEKGLFCELWIPVKKN